MDPHATIESTSSSLPDRIAARTHRDLLLDAWSGPGSRVMLASVALAAAWATHTSTLPATPRPALGAIAEIVLWMLMYAVLVVVLGTSSSRDRQSASRVSQRLGMALLLGLVSAHVVKLGMSPLLKPSGWYAYHYLRLLVAPALAAVWCMVLLPAEMRAALQSARARESVFRLPTLAVLLVAAAVLVSCSDLAFQLVRHGSAVQDRLSTDVITRQAWLTTAGILFLVEVVVFVVTSSAATALLLVSPIFATMVFATMMKIRFMHSAVQPLDLLKLPEFMPLFGAFFGAWAAIGSTITIACWLVALVVVWRRTRTRAPASQRVVLGTASFVPLSALVTAILPSSVLPSPLAVRSEAMQRAVGALGAPFGEHRDMSRRGGIVLNFLTELQSAFVVVPRDYSVARIQRLARSYPIASSPVARRRGGVSLVVYLVESLMDPNDLGFRYSSDPIPNLRALRREQVGGYAIVPGSFGGSANTEFELLTGMTTSFLPEGSIPYRQHIRWPIPSLVRTLRDLGYATVAVQADPKYYYDRERVYPLLGFDRTVWLHAAKVPKSDRGTWPSDEVIVDSVIAAQSRSHPAFVFAFPSSTHSPYNTGTYAKSALDVVDAPPGEARAEAQEYANAQRVADRAIARLIDHFRMTSDSTIVVVMGDHLPPLSTAARERLSARLAKLRPEEQTRATRRVPLLVWANFTLPHSEPTLSTNMLPPFLLERMGVARTGLFAVTDSVRRVFPVVSACVENTDGRLWPKNRVPVALRGSIEDYRMLQYDLLLGRQLARR